MAFFLMNMQLITQFVLKRFLLLELFKMTIKNGFVKEGVQKVTLFNNNIHSVKRKSNHSSNHKNEIPKTLETTVSHSLNNAVAIKKTVNASLFMYAILNITA